MTVGPWGIAGARRELGVSGRLAGKVALITGTGGGQGRVAALRFAQEGAAVVGCDIQKDGNEETVELVKAAGGQMTGMAPIDLGDAEQCRQWVAEAAAVHGRVDVLYNNASAAKFGPLPDISLEDWHFTIRNEVDLVFFATKFAWPHLAAHGGVIINIASVAGLVANRAAPMAPHAAAKGAVIALTRQTAAEGAAHGIRAVAISPGPIATPGTAAQFEDPALREVLFGGNLITRAGQPAEVVDLAVFLASSEASYVTGSNFVVDGGMCAI
jgi:meso-butanediol dehydrogenase / (S,S)-butanediol dehydrogenase / diacetyl reductase